MAGKVERPIIFPLSNPYDRAEAVPGDLIHWTDGRALVATGTEFPPAALKDRTIKIAQCNNFYIFPAIGLAVRASEAKRVTDRMMLAAAKALGNISQDSANTATELLPPIENMRGVAIQIAVMVGLQAQQDGVAQIMSEQDLRERAQRRFWIPQYLSYKLIRKENISN
jgi:malate dehydrogenase (oxaloacetate-decarboxylating)